ncbi:TrbI/VirB10 family protein [Rhizobacter sp. SG703]|uniref:TrbI/VirB10 family protein n=1 Tax=Rhizobacter sp. SG703 TaxID=2587140 RepID=UPI001446F9ED|nr:TrbI/VirB10 family protein [Rhizobacter sp. SG703]NKI94857.1 type IV secretory pathway VirB10-like protein [Rhizobacter sp. SG703]
MSQAPTPPRTPPAGAAAQAFDDSVPPTQPPGADEQVSQHGKRVVIVGAVLGGLIVGGLLVDSLRSPPKPVAAVADTGKPPPQDPFVDFEAKQRVEAARLETERQKKLALERARAEAQREAPPPSAAAPRSPEQDLRETARMEDLKRSLAAVSSHEMLVSNPRSPRDPKEAPRRTGATTGAAGGVPAAGTAAAGSVAAAAVAADAQTGQAPSTLTRLRQAIDRVRGGSGAGDEASRYVRDLGGAQASGAIVGQTATARRERGDAQREGEYLVPVGTVMAAVLDIEVNSDWEGRWRALIARDIYDLNQDVILIPKGTRVLGSSARPKPVNEAINERMALIAQWLVLPNGARIDLSRSAMLDGAGVAALEGDVNRHFLATLGGVAAYGVIGGLAATRAVRSTSNDTNLAVSVLAGRDAGAEIAAGLADVGRRVASRYLNLVPTIVVKPGTPMNVFLDDELFLRAWAPIDEFAPAVAPQSMR